MDMKVADERATLSAGFGPTTAIMRDLAREYQDAAREAAEQAYDREMENWQ